MLMIKTPERGTDPGGSGDFGANRGSRLHMGVDYAAWPGSILLSPVKGIVTRLGYPYGDDLSYTYVEVTDKEGNRHRFFYIDPSVDIGEAVRRTTPLGTVQDVSVRYPVPRGMKPHIHYEIINKDGVHTVPFGED